MIVSASRRTDIPAFYSDWLLNRVREGFVMVRNPMNVHSVSKIILDPEVVDCIVLWTKNPERLMPKLHLLGGFTYYFQFTVTPYSQDLEPNLPETMKIIGMFRSLSQQIGPRRLVWRYDPIILTQKMDINFHRYSLNKMPGIQEGYTHKCAISFLDLYKKSQRNLLSIPLRPITLQNILELTQFTSDIARKFSIQVVTCAEDIDLTQYGVQRGKCIDDKLISEIAGKDILIDKDKNQRHECGCVASVDIGAYNTCPHGCLYCYANFNSNMVKQNFSMHNPKSPLLFGELGPTDKINIRKIKSCFEMQKRLL